MESVTTKPPRHVIIIGGGFAGLECARRLANVERFRVTLIDRTNHHLFQPLLYQVATASLAGPDIAHSIRQILEHAKNVTVLMEEITAIDPASRTVTGSSGMTLTYDKLVLAAGARTAFFGHDEWALHAMGLKTLADAQAIRRTVLTNLELAERSDNEAQRKRLMTVAIVGGGPTGVELAGAFADLLRRSLKTNFRRIDTGKLRIILIESSEHIIDAYDEEQCVYARRRLESLGVEIRNHTRVSNIRPGVLELNDGTELESAAIIWSAGISTSPLTAQLGAPTDRAGRVCPEPDLSLPGHPDVFVVGDVVSLKKPDGSPVPGVAPAAVQMGAHAAEVMLTENRRPFSYHDKGMMAIIGKNHAVVKTERMQMKGFVAWLAWLFVHILFLVGFRNKISVLLGWAWAYLIDKPGARVIVYPPSATAPSAGPE